MPSNCIIAIYKFMSSKIFISIASYRDPQIVPTIKDLVAKTKNIQNIRIGLCLQGANNEADKKSFCGLPVDIIEYDWRESKGTCWARHMIQKLLFQDEDFYFQLDSHHRFCEHWDTKLLDMFDELKKKCSKPIIGGYCPGYKTISDTNLEDKPMRICSFPDFTDLGDLMFMPKLIKNYEQLREKKLTMIPARFLSGHFIFTDGGFVKHCMYDPNLYFRGEELSLSARAYTNGYDFFHPLDPIVWHEYLRESQPKHWDDHTKDNGFITTHETRSSQAKKRVRQLLGMENRQIQFGKYDLGRARDLHTYELYAGISLSSRKIHKYAYNINDDAPDAKVLSEKEWSEGLMEKIYVEYDFPKNYIAQLGDPNKIQFLAIVFEDKINRICYRKDIKPNEFHNYRGELFTIEASMESVPNRVNLVPYLHNKGFGQKTTIRNLRISQNV